MTTSLTKDETPTQGGSSFSRMPAGVELARVRPSDDKMAVGLAAGAAVLAVVLWLAGLHLGLGIFSVT